MICDFFNFVRSIQQILNLYRCRTHCSDKELNRILTIKISAGYLENEYLTFIIHARIVKDFLNP